MWPFWVKIVALAFLGFYLAVKHRQRALAAERRSEERRRIDESQWNGAAFDIRAVWPRIQRLRQDYATAARSRPRHSCYRKWLLASVKQTIEHRGYFRSVKENSDLADAQGQTNRT